MELEKATEVHKRDLSHLGKYKEQFGQILSNNFNSTAFIADVLRAGKQDEQLTSLRAGIRKATEDIHQEVLLHQSQLLAKAEEVSKLKERASSDRDDIRRLKNCQVQLRARLMKPYQELFQCSTQYENLQLCCEVLRHVLRFTRLLRRLKAHLHNAGFRGPALPSRIASISDLVKAAQVLNEVGQIFEEQGAGRERKEERQPDQLAPSLPLIEIAEMKQHLPFIESARTQVLECLDQVVWKGLENVSPNEVGIGLQGYHNMKVLPEKVKWLVSRIEEEVSEACRAMFDISAQSEDGGKDRKITWRAALWVRVEEFSEAFAHHVRQAASLHQMLLRKRDANTNVLYLQIALNGREPSGAREGFLGGFWKRACSSISRQFQEAAKSSSFVRSVLVNEYPRLSVVFHQLFTRIERASPSKYPLLGEEVEVGAIELETIGGPDHKAALLTPLLELKTDFLNRMLSKLNEPVRYMFAHADKSTHDLSNLPSLNDVTAFISSIHGSLDNVQKDVEMTLLVAKNVHKSLALFCTRCQTSVEERLDTDSPLLQFSNASPPVVHQRNAHIFKLMCAVEKGVEPHLLRQSGIVLTAEAEDCIAKAASQLTDVCRGIVGAMNKKVLSEVEATLFDMKRELLARQRNSRGMVFGDGSRYMRKLCSQLEYFVSVLHPLYQPTRLTTQRQAFLDHSLRTIAMRVVTVFIRHASLLHPLQEEGKLLLTNDMAQLEGAVHGLVSGLHKDAVLYLRLRALKEILFMQPRTLGLALGLIKDADEPPKLDYLAWARKNMPVEFIQHLLTCHAPPTGSSPLPHDVLGWTLPKFFRWVDSHSSEDVLQLLSVVMGELQQNLGFGKDEQLHAKYFSHYPALVLARTLLHEHITTTK